MVFCVFKFQKKMGEFAVFIEHSKAKSVSASGGLCHPDPPTRGSAPDSHYRLALRALAMPPLPNPKYATVLTHHYTASALTNKHLSAHRNATCRQRKRARKIQAKEDDRDGDEWSVVCVIVEVDSGKASVNTT